jgi:hypothetical protein
MKFILSGFALALLPTALSYAPVKRAPVCELSGRHGNQNKITHQTGLTLDQCVSKCQTTSSCLSVQFAKSGSEKGYCNLFSVAAQKARTKPDIKNEWFFYDRDCRTVQPPVQPPVQPTVQCGVYGDGNDFYKTTTVKDVEQCKAACKSDDKCKSSEFKPSNGKCWLYSKPVSEAKTKDDTKGTWIFNDRDCPTAQPSVQCGVYGDGRDFYKTTTVPSVEQCMATCKSDDKCKSSEFKPSNGKCWLYSKPVSEAKTKDDTKGTWIFNDRDCAKAEQSPVCGVIGNGIPCQNGLLQHIKSGSGTVEKCASACLSKPDCKSYHVQRAENGGSQATGCWLLRGNATACKGPGKTGVYFDRECAK